MAGGPCLCGDTQCPSCGPAQGNWRCPICRAWADTGCAHIDEDSGELKPEFEAEAKAKDAAEAAADEALAAEYEKEEEEWN